MSKCLDVLETLKLLKDFVLENNKNGLDKRFIIGSCDILEKELKAFEVIKELPDKYKEGLVYILLNALNERKITQEEYELLKEVLL